MPDSIVISPPGLGGKAEQEKAPLLLLVDDARVMRIVLQESLESSGYKILVAETGEDALDLLQQHARDIDAVVLDREMPGIDGLEVVRQMKSDSKLASIPVIMFTATDAPDKIQEGIDAGVFYYLVKPATSETLKSVIDSALRESAQKRRLFSELNLHGGMLKTLQSCRLAVQTLAQAEDAACLLAACFPQPERVITGLMELLVNAVEHGNLGITYDEKFRLLENKSWRGEVNRRALAPENASKFAAVTYQRKDGNYLVQITDAGEGFDWKRYWYINPARATASHGRGIARARLTAFDQISYNDKGNSVTVMVREALTLGDYAW